MIRLHLTLKMNSAVGSVSLFANETGHRLGLPYKLLIANELMVILHRTSVRHIIINQGIASLLDVKYGPFVSMPMARNLASLWSHLRMHGPRRTCEQEASS